MTDIWVVVLLAIVGAGVLGAITWGVGSEIWAAHLRRRSDEADRKRREEYAKAHPPIPIQHYIPPEGEPVPPPPPQGYGPWQIVHMNWGMGESWDVTRAANDLTHVQTHSRWDTERGAEVALAEVVRTSESDAASPKESSP